MARVKVRSFSISIDGFGAGPQQSLENPLGVGGKALHEWAVPGQPIRPRRGDRTRPRIARQRAAPRARARGLPAVVDSPDLPRGWHQHGQPPAGVRWRQSDDGDSLSVRPPADFRVDDRVALARQAAHFASLDASPEEDSRGRHGSSGSRSGSGGRPPIGRDRRAWRQRLDLAAQPLDQVGLEGFRGLAIREGPDGPCRRSRGPRASRAAAGPPGCSRCPRCPAATGP